MDVVMPSSRTRMSDESKIRVKTDLQVKTDLLCLTKDILARIQARNSDPHAPSRQAPSYRGGHPMQAANLNRLCSCQLTLASADRAMLPRISLLFELLLMRNDQRPPVVD